MSAKLLIVDDEEPLRRWAGRVLEGHGYSCDSAPDAAAARERLEHGRHHLALLDINMPGESGIDLLTHIRRQHTDCAVVMVTGEDSIELAMTAIEHGAFGYIIKPAETGELLINVANALRRRSLELEALRTVKALHTAAMERGEALEQVLQDLRVSESKLWASQAETIFRLARMVEFRDEETGEHVRRMSSFCEILAYRSGSAGEECELLRLASQLHDVGKVAIPDEILLKPGELDEAERETIETHAEIGYKLLAGSPSPVVQLGAQIAHTHHERWDGSGYPRGLQGHAIPREGRIAAIADVFDALTSDRVYRTSFPLKVAIEKMQAERGRHFDAELLDVFLTAMPEVESVRDAQFYGI